MATDAAAAIELHRLAVAEPEMIPFAIGDFDSIGPLSRADFPHRHTFYEIVLLTAGTGSHVIDFVEYRLRPPQLGLLTPGQVHYWRATGTQGYVMLCDDAFWLHNPADREVWRKAAALPWRDLTSTAANDLRGLLEQVHTEARQRRPGFLSVVRALSHVFLVRAGRDMATAHHTAFDRMAKVAAEFETLVSESMTVTDSVHDYASHMGLSVSYLSEAVKTVTGRSPGQLIRRRRVLEARRLLGGTAMGVGQVSKALGFNDPAYFCRFFRREMGVSPGQYRRGIGEKHHN